MSQSLISSLTASLGAETINRVAVDTGASEEKVVNGFRAAVAAILGGIVKKADEPNGMRQVFELVTGGTSTSLVRRVSSIRMLRQLILVRLFWNRVSVCFRRFLAGSQSSVVQGISDQSDLPSDVVVQIMGMAAPMVLSLLGRRVKDQEISLSAFPNLLVPRGR